MDKADADARPEQGAATSSTRPTPRSGTRSTRCVFYQRPQITAVNKNLANVGSFGFAQPDYTKIGFMNNPS